MILALFKQKRPNYLYPYNSQLNHVVGAKPEGTKTQSRTQFQTLRSVALTSSPPAMEASIFPAVLVSPSSATTTTTTTVVHGGGRVTDHSKPVINLISRDRNNRSIKNHRFKTPTTAAAAINDVLAAADPDQVAITWQIVVGALAGVTPFVVAGIEFSKRIVAQRKCGVCGGSGLVLRDKYYFRCPGCGGFLPWQSWKRFFSG
ncbi:hypothetical protein ACSBR1_011322 [Camellia fascicularis]